MAPWHQSLHTTMGQWRHSLSPQLSFLLVDGFLVMLILGLEVFFLLLSPIFSSFPFSSFFLLFSPFSSSPSSSSPLTAPSFFGIGGWLACSAYPRLEGASLPPLHFSSFSSPSSCLPLLFSPSSIPAGLLVIFILGLEVCLSPSSPFSPFLSSPRMFFFFNTF
jgi:hypothetical protein